MDSLRRILRWLRTHRLLSIGLAVFFVAFIFFARTLITRLSGEYSPPLKRSDIVDAVYGIGTVTATRSYAVKPGTTSTITDLFVREGDSVKKGEKLVNLDNVIYRAPFNGVVNFLPFKVGENVFIQFPVMVVTDLLNRYMVVSLEQQGALRIRAGQKAKLSFDSIRSQNFDGVVQSVYSYSSNFLARIDFTNLPPEILPDMTADVAIVVRELKNVLTVPVSSLENNMVWVKRGHGLAKQVKLGLGVVDGAVAEVLGGDIQEGDQVLIRKKVRKP